MILFGKYNGLTFQQLLKKDISYCEYIAACPTNDKTQKFKEYVISELPQRRKDILKAQIQALQDELKAN